MGKKLVVYYVDDKMRNPVWDFIKGLSSHDFEKCLEYIAYLEEVGEQVRRPVGDYLGNKLYELRPKQTRILYFFTVKNYAVLLHAFCKKTNEVPKKDMDLAYRRMNDFILRYKKGEIRLGGEK